MQQVREGKQGEDDGVDGQAERVPEREPGEGQVLVRQGPTQDREQGEETEGRDQPDHDTFALPLPEPDRSDKEGEVDQRADRLRRALDVHRPSSVAAGSRSWSPSR
jgi:hypothetical protein